MNRLPGRIQRDQRDGAGVELRVPVCAHVGMHGDDAGRAPRAQVVGPRRVVYVAPGDLDERGREPVLPGDPAHPTHHLDGDLTFHIGEDDLHSGRRGGLVRPPVSVFAQHFLDPPARVQPDP